MPNDDFFFLDKIAVKRIMDLQRIGPASLAQHAGKNPSSVSVWINEKRKISYANASDLAKVLGCTVEHLRGLKVFHKFKDSGEMPAPGTAEYYARAIHGQWFALSRVAAGQDFQGRAIPESTFSWEVDLVTSANQISGTCLCKTEGFEHGHFNLEGEINGRGFVLIDGVRGIPDGAEDFIRGLFQFYSDAKTQTIYGGYVMYWAEHRHIFEGHAVMHREKPK